MRESDEKLNMNRYTTTKDCMMIQTDSINTHKLEYKSTYTKINLTET